MKFIMRLKVVEASVQTENEIFFVPGPASSLLDMAIGSLLASGEDYRRK
jgi:hypothetical protein